LAAVITEKTERSNFVRSNGRDGCQVLTCKSSTFPFISVHVKQNSLLQTNEQTNKHISPFN